MKKVAIFCFVASFISSPDAPASYQMFCELKGSILSTPNQSQSLEFEFLVNSAREVELEVLGEGATDCHALEGKTITVVLDRKDAGNRKQLVPGARIVLERYEVDAVNSETGAIVRSITHVRKDI